MSLWLPFLLFVAAGLAVPLGRLKTGDFLAPASLFAATWCGALAFYFLRLMSYPPMASGTFALVAATMAIVVTAMVVGQHLATRRAVPRRGVRMPVRPELWVLAYSALGLLGVLWYTYGVVRVLGWRSFEDPSFIRQALGTYAIPSTFLFLEFFCVAAPILACGLAVCGTRVRPWVWAGPVLCGLATGITTDRTQFFLVVLGCFLLYAYRWGPRLTWRSTAVMAALCMTVLIADFLLVGAWIGKTPSNLGVTMQVPGDTPATQTAPLVERSSQPEEPAQAPAAKQAASPGDRWIQRFSTLYLYLTGSFAALDVLLREPLGTTKGLHTIYPVARLLEKVGLVRGPVPPAIPQARPLGLLSGRDVNYNAYTFLYYPLMDFGRVGALLYAAVVGLVTGWVYALMRMNRVSPMHLILMAHFATALLLTIFVNKFNNTASWYVGLATILPFALSARRPSKL
jgi:hypothetical protein